MADEAERWMSYADELAVKLELGQHPMFEADEIWETRVQLGRPIEEKDVWRLYDQAVTAPDGHRVPYQAQFTRGITGWGASGAGLALAAYIAKLAGEGALGYVAERSAAWLMDQLQELRRKGPVAEAPNDDELEQLARWRVLAHFAIDHRDDLDALQLAAQERRPDGASYAFILDGIRYEVDLYLVDGMPLTSRVKRISVSGEPFPPTQRKGA